MRNIHLTFGWHYIGQKLGQDFAKFCGLLRIYELYISIQFDQFWTDLIKSDQTINKVENLTIYFNDYFIINYI